MPAWSLAQKRIGVAKINPYDAHLSRSRDSGQVNGATTFKQPRSNRYFHNLVDKLVSSQVIPNSRVLDLGCADGSTLRACRPSVGIGVDLNPEALPSQYVEDLRVTYIEAPVEVLVESPLNEPDYIVMSMLLDEVYDVQHVLAQAHNWSTSRTRLVIVTYSRLWRPVLRLAEIFRIKNRVAGDNYVPWAEVENMLKLESFEVTKRLDGILLPVPIPLLSRFVNRWLAPLPILRAMSLVRVTVARSLHDDPEPLPTVSIIVAARNEAGHVHELIERIPLMADRQELIFVEGNSTDDTWEVIQRAIAEYAGDSRMTLHAYQQPGKGKGDAVRAGFLAATGEILVILDADISVPPEELPRFVEALRQDKCEFANGSRLVYPMDAKAMRFLNLIGNKFFGGLFSYLLGQRIRDTLCGTKVLRKSDYERIAANRSTFGDFDPFGDFDLLFGASYCGLHLRDVPVHYKERRYGETNISRFSHGLLLLRMSAFAATRLKFVG